VPVVSFVVGAVALEMSSIGRGKSESNIQAAELNAARRRHDGRRSLGTARQSVRA
jgi:hypothetical protein